MASKKAQAVSKSMTSGARKPVAWSESAKETAVEQVLEAMAEGQTVKEAVEKLALGVSPGTLRRWMSEREAWMTRYHQAKKLLAYALAEEAITVARESTNHSSAADRVLIETLKWAASKANPAEYGERQTVEHQGAQALTVKIVEDVGPIRNDQALRAVEQSILAPTQHSVPLLPNTTRTPD